MRLSVLLALIFMLSASDLHGQCMANFTFADNGLTVQFTDASMNGGSPITSWSWDFDDGGTSTQQNPSHTFQDPDNYNVCLTITTQNGCSDQFCFDLQICTLQMTASVDQNCDANGEISVNVTISDPFDQAISINVSVDGVLVPGSPFDIDDNAPVVLVLTIPGDGLEHTILAQSEEVGHCNAEYIFTAPDCNSNCFLSALNIQFAGGTTHDVNVGDNFFSPANLTIQAGDIVRWTLTGDGHSTTSDATTGPDSWNSGVLGQGAVYQRTIYNPGLHPYYCIPHGGPGGAGMSATIVSNCPQGNGFTLNITFNTTIAGPQGFDLLLDGIAQPGSPFPYDGVGPNSVTLDLAGDGLSHMLEIRDVADPTCILTGQVSAPDCGQAPTCMLGVTAMITSGCDAADMMDVTLEVTSINGGATGFRVRVDGVIAITQVDYDPSGTTTVIVPVIGDGASHTITVEDISDNTCSASTGITTENCMIACTLSGLTLSAGTSTTHPVQVQDFQFVPQDITITSGDRVEFIWTGDVQHTSTSDAVSGPDSWDSGLFGFGATFLSPVLSEGVHPYYCIPHGGPGGVGMAGTITVQADCTNGEVAVLVSFVENGGSFTGFNVLVDGTQIAGGPFPYSADGNNNISVNVTGDGQSHTITIVDADDPACTISSNIITPDCNASTCQLTINAQENGPCNGTTVPVQVIVSDIGGGLGGFNIAVDGLIIGTYDYDPTGTTTVTINVEGDGLSHNILVTDIDDPSCFAETNLITTDCSIPCILSGLSLNTGNATTHTVEVQDFQFSPQHISIASGDRVEFVWTGVVAHTSTSDATSGPDSWDSGLLGQGSTYLSPVLTEGVHPYYCIPHGGPGGIGMSGTITVAPNCNNGQVAVNVSFNESGGGFSGYNVLIDQTLATEGPFTYDPDGINNVTVLVPGDGQSHQITVKDIDDPSCAISLSIVTPDCSASSCQLTVNAAISGECNAEQMLPVQLTITGLNTGASGFRVLVDGVVTGDSPYLYDTSGTTSITVLLSGDGMQHIIVVEDVDDPTCNAGTNITLPDCSLSCQIFDLEILPDITSTYIVEVQDFAFSPQHLTIAVGDTVHFVWTGAVAHTTTSDATSGPDTWDSGLLDQGATYEVIITEAGLHPYYCIPHGGPGGIGMAGTISALADCENGMANITLSFQQSGGSLTGFFVTVDGDTLYQDPLPYALTGPTILPMQVPGDGSMHTVQILDAINSECIGTLILTAPDCNAIPCSLGVDAMIAGGCTQAGLVPVDVVITSVSGSAEGFNVFADGIIVPGSPFMYDPSGTTMLQIFLPGDMSTHQIFIHDIGDVSCTAIIPIETPDCSGQCVIDQFTISFAEPAMHVVEVRDFEFFPKHLNIALGDTVRFVWTGQIAHTSTSDAAIGPDSWESGLLGNGAVFDLVLTTLGAHPYYCIPHGAPGGIGMAGSITVEEICANGILSADICFNAANGSFSGYQIVIDGTTYGPYNYSGSGHNCARIDVSGDGLNHQIQIADMEELSCTLDTALIFPDCNDPCFGFEADFSYTYNPQTLEVMFMNMSSSSAVEFEWMFGDGNTSTLEDPVHVYDSAQTYEVCLVARDSTGCSYAICRPVPLGQFICEPDFTIAMDGLKITLTDVSETSEPVQNRIWSFGDGEIAFDQITLSHAYGALGVYDICLSIMTDSCMETICKTIDLSDPCIITKADFTHMNTEATTVQFSDQSEGNITSRLWGFGDGITSGQQNPVHVYEAPGVYTVCLLVFDNQNNCSEFICRDIAVQTTGARDLPGIKPLILYPNPVFTDDPSFSLIGIAEADLGRNGQVLIHTIEGRLVSDEEVYCEEQLSIQVQKGLAGGIYLVQLHTGKNVYSGKLVIR